MDPAVRLQLVYHVDRAQAAKGRLGRRRLAAVSGLSEMSVRLELQRLRDSGWVTLARSGVELTKSGRRRFSSVLDRIRDVREVDLTSLRLGAYALAGLVAAHERSAVWAVRDLAVREGATGLLLLRCSAAGWSFSHNDEPVAEHNPTDAATLATTFPKATANDRLVVAFAPDLGCAGLALWRVLAELAAGWQPV